MSVLLIISAHFIILFALLRVGKHLIGFVNLLELLLCCFIAWVNVGVMFACQLAICLPNLFLVGILSDA